MLAVQFSHMQLEVFKMFLIQQVSFGLYIQSFCNLHFTAAIHQFHCLKSKTWFHTCLQKQRSTEEIEMLQAEMLNTLEYFWTCRTKLEHKIQKLHKKIKLTLFKDQYLFCTSNMERMSSFSTMPLLHLMELFLFLQECQCHHYMIRAT